MNQITTLGSTGAQQMVTEREQTLKDLFSIATAVSHGIAPTSETQVHQVLSQLVRQKLLTADDSFRLQDQLRDIDAFDRTLDLRVERALQDRGQITANAIQTLKNRIAQLESAQAR